jgi:hypothetical protein
MDGRDHREHVFVAFSARTHMAWLT